MKLKICGMKYTDNIREVAALSPDFMGFVFYPKSKRFVGDDFVMPDIPSRIKRAGVFVNEPKENILKKVSQYKLDFVQLHGDETVDFCKGISEKVKVIKAFGVDPAFDFSVLNEYHPYCEYFLFDKKTKEYGGSGRSFNHDFLRNYRLSKSFFISGGLDLAVLSKLQTPSPGLYAVDVNSKFEITPGLKDIHKLKILQHELSGKR